MFLCRLNNTYTTHYKCIDSVLNKGGRGKKRLTMETMTWEMIVAGDIDITGDDAKRNTSCETDEIAVEQTPRPQQLTTQPTIRDLFGAISRKLMEKGEMVNEAGYLLEKKHEILSVLKTDMRVEMFF